METIEQMYYENPEFWDGSLFTEEDHLRLSFVANHIPQATKSLCDVGCGNGLFLKYLAGQHPELILHGVDRSKAALNHVTAPKTLASITSLPFGDASFDTACCLEVIEHLPEQQYRVALSELSRIAARYVIVSVPLDQDLRLGQVECSSCKTLFNPDYHLRSFSKTDMPDLLKPYGFRMTSCAPYGASQEFALSKLITKLKADVRNRFPVEILCPACGHAIAGCARTEGDPGVLSTGATVKKYIKSVWPKITVDRWMLVIYERDLAIK
jgi:ubiquinone/menaquinone biosynthesis C-methylase UbiE